MLVIRDSVSPPFQTDTPHVTALGAYFVDYLSLWTVSWIRLRVPVYECVRTESVEVTVNFSDV